MKPPEPFDPAAGKPRSDVHLLRRAMEFVRPYRRQLMWVYLLYFVNSVLNLLPAASLVAGGCRVQHAAAIGKHQPLALRIGSHACYLGVSPPQTIQIHTPGVVQFCCQLGWQTGWQIGWRSHRGRTVRNTAWCRAGWHRALGMHTRSTAQKNKKQ